MNESTPNKYAWLWDVMLTDAEFDSILFGKSSSGAYDREWAALRLIEYAPYGVIRRLLSDAMIRELWPVLAPRVRSDSRRMGMDFLYQWLIERAA